MPFLASYLIYHFPVSVVNNHTEISSVVFTPSYFFCTFVLSLVSRSGCSWDVSMFSGFCFVLRVGEQGAVVSAGPGVRGFSTAASFPLSPGSRTSCRWAETVANKGSADIFSSHLEKRVFSSGEIYSMHSLCLRKVACSRLVLEGGSHSWNWSREHAGLGRTHWEDARWHGRNSAETARSLEGF